MTTHFIIKFLIAIVVIRINNNESMDLVKIYSYRPTDEATYKINHICKSEHWKDTSFDEVNCGTYWIHKQNLYTVGSGRGLRVIDKLNIVPNMIGCAYGQHLNDFFLLTVYTIEVCHNLAAQNNVLLASECWKNITDSYKFGAGEILRLMAVFKHFHDLASGVTDLCSFYQVLMPLRVYLISEPNVTLSIVSPPAKSIYWFFKEVSGELRAHLDVTCRPNSHDILIEDIDREFLEQNAIVVAYDFYVSKLQSSLQYISTHMTNLGFSAYDPADGKVYNFIHFNRNR